MHVGDVQEGRQEKQCAPDCQDADDGQDKGGQEDMNIWVVRQDITVMPVDAIVNAANPWLTQGGGVDGAIHRNAGPALAEALASFPGGCKVGQAVMTPGFGLPARHIIHAVGPDCKLVSDPEEQDALLRATYTCVLQICAQAHVKTVAIPAISTGCYGFNHRRACRAAVSVMRSWSAPFPEAVYLVPFTPEMEKEYILALEVIP